MELDCPNCGEDVDIGDCWEALGEEFTCPHCECRYEVNGDYGSGESGWYFSLVETPDWIQEHAR